MEKITLDKLKAKIWENRKMIIILIMLFLFAFTIRAHLMTYESLFGFDSYYHARIAGDLAEFGTLPEHDPIAYYQEGGSTMPPMNLFWIVSALIYNIFTFGAPFNKEVWIIFVKVLPALFGALISITMYWLGKEMFSKKKNDPIGKYAGITMVLIAATIPSFVYRTMASFFEDDSLGFLWMVIGLVFFVRAVKSREITKESIGNSLIAGFFFTLMAFTWSFYEIIPFLLALYFLAALPFIALTNKREGIFAFIANFGAGYILFNAAMFIFGSANWLGHITALIPRILPFFPPNFMFALGLLVTAAIVFIGIAIYISGMNKENKQIAAAIFIILLYVVPIGMGMMFMMVSDIQDRTSIASMVGEENTGKQFFGTKYNSLIIFPVIAILLIPASLALFKKKHFNHPIFIALFWIAITWAMAYYKLKYTYTFGLPIAVAAGFTTYFIFNIIKKADFGKGMETKIIVTALAFVLLLGIGSSAVFVPDKVPYIETNSDWKEVNNWIINNTSEDAKLFNWWDQGHIIAFTTERGVSSDNRNWSYEANHAMATFVITADVNKAYDIAANEIGADYIILDSSMFLKEATFKFYDLKKIDYGNPEVVKYYEGIVRTISCSEQGENVNCQGNIFSKTDYEALSATWNPSPTQFVNGRNPVYIYRSNRAMIAINQAVNNSNLAKVWFNSPEIDGFYEEVFSNHTVKILKILR